MEKRTARLTVLIDPRKKAAWERICEEDDITPSQVIRQFIRDSIEKRLGPDWKDEVLNEESQDALN